MELTTVVFSVMIVRMLSKIIYMKPQQLGNHSPFTITSQGVCTNPIYLGTDGQKSYICVGKNEGKWYAGYRIMSDENITVQWVPPSLHSSKGYPTAETAALTTIYRLYNVYKWRMGYTSFLKTLENAVQEIHDYLTPTITELEIFQTYVDSRNRK